MKSGVLRPLTGGSSKPKRSHPTLNETDQSDTNILKKTRETLPFVHPMHHIPPPFGQESISKHLTKTEQKFWQRTDKYTMSIFELSRR